MPPVPPDLSTIIPSSIGISTGPNLYLGPNSTIKNSTDGFSTTSLPITTNSVLNVGTSINVNKQSDGTSKLVINSSGNLNTAGIISATGDITSASTLYGNQLNIGSSNCTISDTGLVTMQDNLVVGTNFNVQKTSGNVTTSGILSVGSTTNSAGTLTVGNASAENYTIQLLNTGKVTAKGDLKIGSDTNSENFVVSSSSGDVTAKGTLNVGNSNFIATSAGAVTAQSDLKIQSSGTDKFTVASSSGDIATQGSLNIGNSNIVATSAGAITAKNDLTIQNSSGTNKFEVTASSGAIVAHNSLTMKSSTEVTTFTLTGSSGNVSMGTSATNGSISTTYDSYVHPDSYSNTSITDNSVIKTSATSNLLTTQSYVDDAIWQQTKRLNLIVGSNDTSLATFSNMFNMAQTLAGNDAVQTLSGLLDTTGEIKTSISTVMNRAYNPVSVNCSSAIWQDECPPMPIPQTISASYPNGNYGMDGWYFKNLLLNNSAASKINWYLPANGSTMKVKHLLNLFLNVYAASDKSLPFISLWTAPKGNSTDLFTGICNANVNFYFTASNSSLTSKKNYTLYTGKNLPANTYNSTLLRCSSTSTRNYTNRSQNNNLGTIQQVSDSTTFLNSFDTSIVSENDTVACFIIQTASTAVAGDVDLVVNNFNIESHDTTSDASRDTTNGTTKFMFSNSSVASNYQYNYLFKTNMDFTSITGTKTEEYFNAYNTSIGRN
jgi:hypothetical protein